ncbi:hypothetical protein [Anaerobaca lacustris]|uniref:Periplasmic heavy metal sensor n=1 Tax=Anaerobaca lacustris TaxID=3044600 RepID=A0AAW6U546_9BACT|nr:hypothetical protein [Sedimentisphaerales bacterium M17dextr]
MVRKAISIGTVACLIALVVAGLAVAQQRGQQRERPQGQGQGPGGERPMRGDFDPQRMQQMMQQRMQEQLGATAEEWTVIGPRLTKVMNLSRQTGAGAGGMRMGMMAPGAGRRGGPEGDQAGPGGRGARGPFAQGEPTAVDTASEALQTTLENTAATPDEIRTKLTTLRTAREKATQELATAQQELKQVLTLRQEAQLVLMGLLK